MLANDIARERRNSLRQPIRLPLSWASLPGACTRDICADGLFVWVPGRPCPDLDWVSVEVPWAQLRFRAWGEVLRVEPGPAGCGLALRLHAARLESRGEREGNYMAADLSNLWRVAKA